MVMQDNGKRHTRKHDGTCTTLVVDSEKRRIGASHEVRSKTHHRAKERSVNGAEVRHCCRAG